VAALQPLAVSWRLVILCQRRVKEQCADDVCGLTARGAPVRRCRANETGAELPTDIDLALEEVHDPRRARRCCVPYTDPLLPRRACRIPPGGFARARALTRARAPSSGSRRARAWCSPTGAANTRASAGCGRAGCPPPRTKWTRRVPHPVLIGHAASLSQVDLGRVLSAAGCNAFAVWALLPPSLPY
jgi:hypothetical protein